MAFTPGVLQVVDDGYAITAALFLRLLGFVALLVVVDIWRQLIPLAGKDGITPVATKAREHQREDALSFVQFPTLCPSNTFSDQTSCIAQLRARMLIPAECSAVF